MFVRGLINMDAEEKTVFEIKRRCEYTRDKRVTLGSYQYTIAVNGTLPDLANIINILSSFVKENEPKIKKMLLDSGTEMKELFHVHEPITDGFEDAGTEKADYGRHSSRSSTEDLRGKANFKR